MYGVSPRIHRTPQDSPDFLSSFYVPMFLMFPEFSRASHTVPTYGGSLSHHAHVNFPIIIVLLLLLIIIITIIAEHFSRNPENFGKVLKYPGFENPKFPFLLRALASVDTAARGKKRKKPSRMLSPSFYPNNKNRTKERKALREPCVT